MLKNRIIGIVSIRNGVVVQSIGFKKWLPLGRPKIAVEFLAKWCIDEIIILDISATKNCQSPDYKMIESIAENIFIPIAVGGGIRSKKDVQRIIHSGSEKVVLNSIALKSESLISECVKTFGSQAIIVSVDLIEDYQGVYRVYDYLHQKVLALDGLTWAKKLEQLGVGEIMLRSVARDGSKRGFDLRMLNLIAKRINIPVIACGGAGAPAHFADCFEQTPLTTAAAGNYFNFSEHSPIVTKAFLEKRGIAVRKYSVGNYKNYVHDSENGRPLFRNNIN